MLSFSGIGGLRASSLEASCLHDNNLSTLSTQTKPPEPPWARNCLIIIIIITTYFKCRNRLNGAKKLGSMCQQHLKSVSKKMKYEKKTK